MKKKNLTIGLTLALSIMSVVPTLAAGQSGWVLKDDVWYYNDRNGNAERDVWRDNATKTAKFYLGLDGKMVTNSVIEYEGDTYYVNGDGVQSRNQWRLLDVDNEGESRWYYFGETGKAYEDGWKNIDGKRYHFTDYKMDYGFLNQDGTMIDKDNQYAWKDAVYYVGDNTTGWRRDNYWLLLDDFDTYEYDRQDVLWLRFNNDGKKVTNGIKSVDNKTYAFDDNGAMITEWYGSATPSSAEYKYYNRESGAQEKNRWFLAIPSEAQDVDDYNNDTLRWFYATSNGTTAKNTLKSINNKKYVFDENGIMLTGFVVVDGNNQPAFVLSDDDTNPSAATIIGAKSYGALMYFDETGAMKTGSMNINLDDDNYTMKFNKQGKALDGESDGYLYNNGILIKADNDNKYEIATVDGKNYLVNTSGKVMKAGKYTSDDYKWEVTRDNTNGYTVTYSNK